MKNIIIQKASKEDWPYIQEKIEKYALDAQNSEWDQFFVAKLDSKTVAFGRIIDHGDYFEIASLGVDYYCREKGVGKRMLSFLIEEAKRIDPQKSIYGVTHRPGFVEKVGFKEIEKGPEALEHKKHNKCILDPSKIKIVKVTP